MSDQELCFLSAVQLHELVVSKKVSVKQVIRTHLDRIELLNPTLKAMITVTAESAMAEADAADRQLETGAAIGPLHGVPVAHKDIFLTKDVRTTHGSIIYEDFVPEIDSLLVERIKKAGAISLGKTNCPEFATGSVSSNQLIGSSVNPYDRGKTPGGSSGGSAVAVRSSMVALATGTDAGGSLRQPASFCNLVALRSSPGRVPLWPEDFGWHNMTVAGPIARTVQDVNLAMSVISGYDPRSPISLETPDDFFLRPLERSFNGCKVAVFMNFSGAESDQQVCAVMAQSRLVLQNLGCDIYDNIEFDSKIGEITTTEMYETLSVYRSAGKFEPLMQSDLDRIPGFLKSQVQDARSINMIRLGQIEKARTQLYYRVQKLFEKYEFLIFPTVQVLPFSITQELGAVSQKDWQETTRVFSLTDNPAISVPAGFSSDPLPLPVGLQIVGRQRDDFGVLQLAHAFEQLTHFSDRRSPYVDYHL